MGGKDKVAELCPLGRVCAMVRAADCVRLMVHRPVPLKQINTLYVNKKIKLL